MRSREAEIREARTSERPWPPRQPRSRASRNSSTPWTNAGSIPEDAMMDVSRVRAEDAGPVLGAAAKLALIGAMAASG